MSEKVFKYIYGVIKGSEKKQISLVENVLKDGARVIFNHGNGCVLSDSAWMDYHSLSKEELAENLVKHQSTIEKMMKENTVIPMKFGTLLNSDDEVRVMLEKGCNLFEELLSSMENKIELDLAATWNDLNLVIKKISEEDEKIKSFKEEIAKKPLDKTFQDRVRIGAMIHSALSEKRNKLKDEILNYLSKVSIEYQVNDVMDDSMILNCAFLLEKSNEKSFDRMLHKLDKQYNENINFRCVGPLPPYSFATCEVKKADFEQIDHARKLFELCEEAKLTDVKSAYRNLVKEKHPDQFSSDQQVQKEFEEIQRAYKILKNYCSDGRCSFRKEDVVNSFVVDRFDIAGTRIDNR
ncbi:MAG: GvpL/GvpF family gas vesicle protein [Candidatus Marinimicrobia bacterium]|nr:GvpL/GvpF family gas vesicle protein [Candidatus Neomarinimicrobiota bacterium]